MLDCNPSMSRTEEGLASEVYSLRQQLDQYKRDAARYQLLRCYHVSGGWPRDAQNNPGILAFTRTDTPNELDLILDRMLGFAKPREDMTGYREDYFEWRKASTAEAIESAIEAYAAPPEV